mmetsp:Transcript_20209/g.51558  ORF Transcript_20209/g.51558 Transcript_20209/m.51558 type:complete len:288 (-) Transcript_20209:80-943(-)
MVMVDRLLLLRAPKVRSLRSPARSTRWQRLTRPHRRPAFRWVMLTWRSVSSRLTRRWAPWPCIAANRRAWRSHPRHQPIQRRVMRRPTRLLRPSRRCPPTGSCAISARALLSSSSQHCGVPAALSGTAPSVSGRKSSGRRARAPSWPPLRPARCRTMTMRMMMRRWATRMTRRRMRRSTRRRRRKRRTRMRRRRMGRRRRRTRTRRPPRRARRRQPSRPPRSGASRRAARRRRRPWREARAGGDPPSPLLLASVPSADACALSGGAPGPCTAQATHHPPRPHVQRSV